LYKALLKPESVSGHKKASTMTKIIGIMILVLISSNDLIGQSDTNAIRLLNDWKNISKPITTAELNKLDRPMIEAYNLYSQLFGPDLFLPVYCFKDLNVLPKLKYVITQKSLNVVVVETISNELFYDKEIFNKTIYQFQPFLRGSFTPLYYFDRQESLANDFISKYKEYTIFPDCIIKPTGLELLLIPYWSTEYSYGTVQTEEGDLFVIESDFDKYPKEKIKDISSRFENIPGVPIVSIKFNKRYTKALIELNWNFGSQSSSSEILLIRNGGKWIFKKEGLITS
jgi:hypothetical protein